jgi:hypothetical protein
MTAPLSKYQDTDCCHKSPAETSHSKTPSAAVAPKDAIYTCPMHPEVRQVGDYAHSPPLSISDGGDGSWHSIS